MLVADIFPDQATDLGGYSTYIYIHIIYHVIRYYLPVRDGGEGIATHQDVEKVQRNGSLKFSWPKTLTKAGCPGNSPRSDGEEMDLGRV